MTRPSTDARHLGRAAHPHRHLARPGARRPRRGSRLPGIDYLRAMVDGELPPPPIAGLIQFGLVEAEPGRVVVHLRARRVGVQPDRRGPRRPGLHAARLGGRLRAAQHAAAGTGYTSIEIKVSYLKPVRATSGTLTAVGTVVKAGSRVAFTEGVVTDASGRRRRDRHEHAAGLRPAGLSRPARVGAMRRVLVTGAARGLGAALVRGVPRARRRGAGHRPSPVTGRPGARRHRADDWAAARAAVEERWGGLDVLVNNAGVAGGGRLDVATLDEWRWITEINLFGVVRGTRDVRAGASRRSGSGHVVNVASLAGLVHPAGMATLQRRQGGRRRAHRDDRPRARAVRRARQRRVPVLLPHRPGRPRCGARTRPSAAVIGRLVETAPLGPDEIAAAVLAGIDRGDELILPDPAGARGVRPQASTTGRRTTRRCGTRPPGCRRCRDRRERSRSATRTPSTSARSRPGCASTPHRSRRDRLDGTPEVRQFPGGASNLTYRLRWPGRRR